MQMVAIAVYEQSSQFSKLMTHFNIHDEIKKSSNEYFSGLPFDPPQIPIPDILASMMLEIQLRSDGTDRRGSQEHSSNNGGDANFTNEATFR